MKVITPDFDFKQESSVFLIAEAGVNHDGKLDNALRLVDAAKAAGADAVKFQTFLPGECTGKFAFMTDYQIDPVNAESRYQMSQRLSLPHADFRRIADYCHEVDILFLSTPDGKRSLDFLVDDLEMPIIKVGSTEVTNHPYLKAIAAKQRPIIFSTGLSTLQEVAASVDILSACGRSMAVLHCTSEYPAPDAEMNLLALETLSTAFDVSVGLSDHSIGVEASLAAVALGAKVIEKHFTLDQRLPGPDHKASLDPQGLAQWVSSIRRVESMLGNGIKQPTQRELRNMASIRRSVVAAEELKAGDVLGLHNLACKRPGNGISPVDFEKIIGMRINCNKAEDEVIQWQDLHP